MNKSFLELCVTDIYTKHASAFSNCTIVVPSKRAITYIRTYLSKCIEKPIFLPEMTTIQDFCISHQNATIPQDFTLIYLLYQAYTKAFNYTDLTKETFEDFYSWGEMLLADFNDIDKYLINPNAIFSNIADEEDIKSRFNELNNEQIETIKRFWNTTKFDQENENDVRKKFVDFWNKLPIIYADFKEILRQKNFCYEGMAMRSVAESDIDTKHQLFNDRQYIFLGFNALSNCETEIFKFLHNRKQAYFYWDYDVYYKDDKYNEAGTFVRKNMELFPNELDESSFNNFSHDKQIRIIKTPNEVAQAKICPSLLPQPINEEHKCAIILADEKLIVPLLSSIPEEYDYNITLGYPLRSSVAYSLFETILDLCNNKKKDCFYFKDIIRLCENPIFPTEFQKQLAELRKYITDEKKITISAGECSQKCNLPEIFNIRTETNNEEYIKDLTKSLVALNKQFKFSDLDKSILYTIYTELKTLETIVKENEIQFQKIKFINNLLKKSLQSKSIDSIGEPLAGLQIMGILEARLLDFDSIILTSVTEGNLPKTSSGSSFIPYSLRTSYGMPTIKEQSAMYSYYFYRLIQRCKNLTILYNEGGKDNKSEKSRFILQLLYESPFKIISDNEISNPQKTLSGIVLDEYNYNITPQNGLKIAVKKSSPEVLQYFESIRSKHSLSPSAISTYITCPMKFYFQNIKHLKVPETVDEMPQPNDIGNFFHHTMYNIYNNYKGQDITTKTIDEIAANEEFIEDMISKALKESKASSNIMDNQSKEFQLTKMKVLKFLEFEKQHTPFRIESLEEFNNLKLSNGIRLGGFIDRVDTFGGYTRVIDYKTGKCSTTDDLQKKICVDDIDNLFVYSKTFQKEALQTFIYSYILKKSNKCSQVQPNLIFIQAINNPDFQTIVHTKDDELGFFTDELCTTFENKLLTFIENDFLNTNEDFRTNNDACLYCDFKLFCGKATD